MDNMFPIYLAETEVKQFNSFCFQIRKQDIGRSDVLIYVEYGDRSKKIIAYNAWAQFKDSKIRAYLCSSYVPNDGDVVAKIVFDLNSNEAFYEQVYSFIAHFDPRPR